jgi:hypothetical protein
MTEVCGEGIGDEKNSPSEGFAQKVDLYCDVSPLLD